MRRSREINIFNLSMLDVIAGAMGAFLIVMVVLLPSYRKQSAQQSPADIAALQEQLQSAQMELERVQSANQVIQTEAAEQATAITQLEEQLKKTFLLIHIQWASVGHDVDLHVIDPKGNEFFWEQRAAAGSTGNLSVDSIIGPGNEVFTDPKALPGNYQILANLFNTHGQADQTTVAGIVMNRDGALTIPSTLVDVNQPMALMATIRVDDDGFITVLPP